MKTKLLRKTDWFTISGFDGALLSWRLGWFAALSFILISGSYTSWAQCPTGLCPKPTTKTKPVTTELKPKQDPKKPSVGKRNISIYAGLSEAKKLLFIRAKANEILDQFGRTDGDEISEDGIGMIKKFVDAYAKRTGTNRNTNKFGDDLGVLLQRGNLYSTTIIDAFSEKGVPPEIGIYVAMIESEFLPCLQSPTGPLGMFQFAAARGKLYDLETVYGATPSNPDDRCDPQKAATAAASYFETIPGLHGYEFLTRDSAGTLLAVAAFNSGDGGLAANVRRFKRAEPKKTKVTFWDLLGRSEILSVQFQSENFNYVPKFLAAAIVGENPGLFGINEIVPLSFLPESGDEEAEGSDVSGGMRPDGLVVPEELYGDGVVKQKAKLREMLDEGFKLPMDFLDLAEKLFSREFVELPATTNSYIVDVGGRADDSLFSEFSFENGSVELAFGSVKYKRLDQFAYNFAGKKYDLNNADDRKQIRIRLLRMLQPRATTILQEIAGTSPL